MTASNDMFWQQLTVTTHESAAPLIAELFSSLGAVSVTFQDAADQPIYEPKPGETRVWHATKVTGLFHADADLEKVRAFISQHLETELLGEWEQHDLEDQVWERAWMDHYHPMRFGDRLWVCPTGQDPPEPGGVRLTLDPGLAFGTGTHPTTALCLEWLADHDIDSTTVLDYGCGSGILAIAAVLLGAEEAYAVDIDPQALTATQDNAEKNRVTSRIHCCFPEQLPSLQVDLLLANILANPLIALADDLERRIRPGGQIVLSGILADQAAAVVERYSPFFELDPPVQQEEWIRLSGVRKAG